MLNKLTQTKQGERMIKFKKIEAGQYYGYINNVDVYEIYNGQYDAGVNYPIWQVSMKQTDKSKSLYGLYENVDTCSTLSEAKKYVKMLQNQKEERA